MPFIGLFHFRQLGTVVGAALPIPDITTSSMLPIQFAIFKFLSFVIQSLNNSVVYALL